MKKSFLVITLLVTNFNLSGTLPPARMSHLWGNINRYSATRRCADAGIAWG